MRKSIKVIGKRKEEDKKQLGLLIRKSRVKKGLLISDVAKAVGYSANHLSNWENGNREPSGLALLRLVKFLEMDLLGDSLWTMV
jgi:transcriptional regulator with XRE-family HTH domain